jgi:hypothetical protein
MALNSFNFSRNVQGVRAFAWLQAFRWLEERLRFAARAFQAVVKVCKKLKKIRESQDYSRTRKVVIVLQNKTGAKVALTTLQPPTMTKKN